MSAIKAAVAEAFALAQRFLSYLPSSVEELPPIVDASDDPDRTDDALLSIVPKDPRKVYKMRSIIDSVLDAGSFFEIGSRWGRSITTGFGRLDGIPVALFAENPTGRLVIRWRMLTGPPIAPGRPRLRAIPSSQR